jgi:DNA-binding MurR/RpiR family transcriptional regulator
MSYENRIRENRHRMSKSFSRLADYILDSYIQAALMTATELAHQVDVDAATVVRFAQRLGYSGFPDLQDEIKERVKQELLIRPEQADEPNSVPGVVSTTMSRIQEAVDQAKILLDVGAVSQLAEKIGNARRIIIIPDSLGQVAAHNMVNLLEQGGFLVTVAQPGVSNLARKISSAAIEDLFLAIDIAGDAPYIARALTEVSAKNIPTAAIVGAASHQSASVADVVIAAQNQPSFGLRVVVVDAIVYTLAEVLRWMYQERFVGVDEAIDELFSRIQVGDAS